MKKAAFGGGSRRSCRNGILEPKSPSQQLLERLELELAQNRVWNPGVVARQMLKRGLNPVLDVVPDVSWTATPHRDNSATVSVSKNSQNLSVWVQPEIPYLRTTASKAGTQEVAA
jgi:hypothetical protein